MNLTPDDLQDLLARAMATAMQQVTPAAPTAGAGAAAIVGRLGPCELGRDKLKRYKRFMDWVGEAESKMRLLGLTTSQQKASFVQSSGGIELSTFWEKEARIRWVASTDPVQDAHTYEEIIAKSKSALLKYIFRLRGGKLQLGGGDSQENGGGGQVALYLARGEQQQ